MVLYVYRWVAAEDTPPARARRVEAAYASLSYSTQLRTIPPSPQPRSGGSKRGWSPACNGVYPGSPRRARRGQWAHSPTQQFHAWSIFGQQRSSLFAITTTLPPSATQRGHDRRRSRGARR
eukprot:scaffold5902_cov376-Prasinococcus_capsulatus_cf.AAC.4